VTLAWFGVTPALVEAEKKELLTEGAKRKADREKAEAEKAGGTKKNKRKKAAAETAVAGRGGCLRSRRWA